MKRLILSLCIITALHTQAQTAQYYDWQWKSCDVSLARFYAVVKMTDTGWFRNDFFMATQKLQMSGLYQDEATETENGWFRYFYSNGNLSSTGRYVNGKKDGLWLSFHYNGIISDSSVYEADRINGTRIGWFNNGYMADSAVYTSDGKAVYVSWFDDGTPSSAGRLLNKKKESTWQYFHKNGNKAALEKYQQGNLISRIYYDEQGIQLADTGNRDKGAVFKGSEIKWRNFLENNLEFPRQIALVNTNIITVVLNATIDEEGNVEDVYVEIPFNSVFDDEALRVMKKSPKWTPATDHNRKIKSYIRQPISFSQE